ncbi:hypothetical protein DFS34DRAFT_87995 [Phlyctochytrium arcticum]|nr:hypothetical protein DFS34DRAFT_87995 [Phlyctochytrium arcticum]
MNQCNICKIEAKLRCSKCKNTYYCSQPHQQQDWKTHKTRCHTENIPKDPQLDKTMSIVAVEGMDAKLIEYPWTNDWNGWDVCPVPALLGFPLMAKPHVRNFGPGGMPYQQIAVYMMVEPATGFAPPKWALGPHCNKGVVGFARRDHKPFTVEEFYELYDFITDLMDEYSENPAAAQRKLTPEHYKKFQDSRKLEVELNEEFEDEEPNL